MELKKVFSQELTNDVRYIREKVFVEEQGFQNVFDEYDKEAVHLVIYSDNKAVATGRIFTNNVVSKVYTIGRVAVLPEYRRMYLGNKVLEFLEEKARELGAVKLDLAAQCQVQDFYHKNGYVARGNIHYEQNCPHIYMEKLLEG